MPRATARVLRTSALIVVACFAGYQAQAASSTVTAVASVDGASSTITISTSGDDGEITFTGTAGEDIGMAVTGVSIGSSGCCGATVIVRKPDGSYLYSASVGTSDSEHDFPQLPTSGAYTIFVDPSGTNTGSATFLLSREATGTAAVVDSSSGGVTTTRAGQNGRVTFTGTAGEDIGMAVTGVSIGSSGCCGATVIVRKPDGSYLYSASVGTSDSEHDFPQLPTSGAYTIFVDPSGTNTGSATFLLSRDNSVASGPIDGEWTLTFTRPGQNGRVRFTGVTGDELYLGADNVTIGSSTCCGLTVSVLKPNGTMLDAKSFGTNGGSLTLPALPTNGTYTLFVDPAGTSTGSITLSLPRAKPIPGLLLVKWYSFDDANCTDGNSVDPVNAIFYGDNAASFISTTQNHVNHHTGWGENYEYNQYFSTNGVCELNEEESASASLVQPRYHIRLRSCHPTGLATTCDLTNAIDSIAVATPHYEHITTDEDCLYGHAVDETDANGWSGFDEARRKVYNMMFKSHFTYEKYVGNTREALQCDGGIAASNGWVRFVRIPSHTH